MGTPGYALGESVATREAYGTALGKLGADQRVVALDAEVIVPGSRISELYQIALTVEEVATARLGERAGPERAALR